jgi:hypothetical protein
MECEDMNVSVPTVQDVVTLTTTFNQHPWGALILLAFVLAGILGVWVLKHYGKGKK